MSTMRRQTSSDKGFTLVEMIATLAILAILAAVSIPALTGFIEEAHQKSYVQEANLVFQAAQAYLNEKIAATNEQDDDFPFDFHSDIALYALDQDENPLKKKLEGSITPGSSIIRVMMSKRNGTYILTAIKYKADNYVIYLGMNEEVKITKEDPGPDDGPPGQN